ncbi:hypothetical protein F4803DRAFT_568569 [Xylaria telfairii]|nr:hypothetical protein F4803DRAFT_568569 [Xylaria telfairii]
MCRRIITHRMHHDVAAPMIIDPLSSNPIVFANPLRTNFHRCELTRPRSNLLLNNPIERCEYHTCCIVHKHMEYCPEFTEHLGSKRKGKDVEPKKFASEHHHERLPYFGNENAYDTVVPATWREMVRIQGSNSDLLPGFTHRSWEEKCFAEGEKLYALECDTAMLRANIQDLREYGEPYYSCDAMRAAAANVLRMEEKLQEQRRLVFHMWSSISFDGY